MNKIQFENLAIRYFCGDLDSTSILLLKDEINKSKEAKKTFEKLQEIWGASMTQEELDSYDYTAAYQRFLQKISTGSEDNVSVSNISEDNNKQKAYTYIYKWVGGIAASLLILLGITYISYQQGQKNLQNTFADIIVSTPNGSCTDINLPDGSTVKLNGGSKLSYSQGYGVKNRIVKLEGEGYFKVKKDRAKPFFVKSPNIIVKVLGTKFNFCDYQQDSQAIVTLDEGKVNMTSIASKEEITLSPNQHVVFDKKSRKMTLADINSLDNKPQWSKGIIAFNGESLKDIASKLERCYPVKFIITPSKQNSLHFYGTFYKENQSIKDIMEALASTGKITYKIKGKNIIIN